MNLKRKMKLFGLLILAVFASEKNKNDIENYANYGENIANNEDNSILVKIEEEEDVKVNKKSEFIGVSYDKNKLKWKVQRWSKNEKKMVYNGYYDDEETAAHASDTFARKLMGNGERAYKLNFPDDYIEVYPEEKRFTSKFIGVSYNKESSNWRVQRYTGSKNKRAYNGYYDDEETAAHASDTLARKLMNNGEQKHKLNFPDDHTEVCAEERRFTSTFIGVCYGKNESKWRVQRWSKSENRPVTNGYFDDEETAAHASDTLAIKLIANGEQKLKLNFPDDHTEVYQEENQNKKRKRSKD